MPAAPAISVDHPVLRAARGAIGLLGYVAILAQLTVVVDLPGAPVVRFLSFFTIESNLVACTVLLLGALRPASSRRRDALRGAATLYVLITGIVYLVVLASTDATLGLTYPWVNAVVHNVVPLALLADWLLLGPAHPVDRRRALRWLLFPVAFFAYSLIRGWFVSWYPYPFLDPGKAGGYSGVVFTGAGMLAVMVLLVSALVGLGNRRRAAIT